MTRTVSFLAAVLLPSVLLAGYGHGAAGHSYGSPPTQGTAHIHARYGEGYVHAPQGAAGVGASVTNLAQEARALGRSKFNGNYSTARQGGSNSRPNLNPGSYRQDGPYYGFGSLNFGPYGTGLFGNGGYGGGGSGFGGGYGGGGYGGGGYGGFGLGGSRYGYGGSGYGGSGYGGYRGYGGYGYGGYGGYGSSGALGYGNPHSRFYFGASPTNDPSTFRYGGNSVVPQVPGFENYAHPSGLVPYSYIYVNPRTPQEPPNPQRIANPFVNGDGGADAPQAVPQADEAPKPAE
jgi:hypothetical protein